MATSKFLKTTAAHLGLVAGLLAGSTQAHAASVTDQHGNEGYDTAQACDAAVLNGRARFYKTVERNPVLRRKGEDTVAQTTLFDLGPQYSRGACDLGAAAHMGRDGVSSALQGRYVPFAPTTPVNAYKDASGKTVRVSMAACDNNFSQAFPRPVALPVVMPVSQPEVKPQHRPAPAPVAAMPVAKPAPVMAPVAAMAFPYVFGTLGAQRDVQNFQSQVHDDHDSKIAAQGGLGYQFNQLFGLEGFAQGGKRLEYENLTAFETSALGLRGTFGHTAGGGIRLFTKLGVARITHTGNTNAAANASQVRPTLGLGMLYQLNNNLAMRVDLDHTAKRSSDAQPKWKGLNYMGVGLQYSF